MKAFQQVDWRKSDRSVTVKEFREYFGQQGVSQKEADRLFRVFDVAKNNTITFKEFNDYFQNPKNGRPKRSVRKQKSAGGYGKEFFRNLDQQGEKARPKVGRQGSRRTTR